MTKDDIRENAFETAASIRNTVWFGTSIDNNVINSLYDDLVLELEQMKRDVEKHRMVTETVYSVIMQLLHDLDFPNRRRLSDRVVMPHIEFFTSNDIYSMERLEQRKQTRLLTFKPPKGFFIGKNGRYDVPGHTRMVKEDNNTVIPFFCARWDGYSILKEEETVEPVVLQDIYTFYDGYTPKMLSGHLALIYNSFCIYVFGMGKKSELTSCPYTQKSIELLKNKILEACYD